MPKLNWRVLRNRYSIVQGASNNEVADAALSTVDTCKGGKASASGLRASLDSSA